jgi:hypothetical protein
MNLMLILNFMAYDKDGISNHGKSLDHSINGVSPIKYIN